MDLKHMKVGLSQLTPKQSVQFFENFRGVYKADLAAENTKKQIVEMYINLQGAAIGLTGFVGLLQRSLESFEREIEETQKFRDLDEQQIVFLRRKVGALCDLFNRFGF